MKIVNRLVPKTTRLSPNTADISKDAHSRLKWFDYYWKGRYDPNHYLETLEDHPHHPRTGEYKLFDGPEK